MRREEVLKSIKEAGVVAVIRGESKEEAIKTVEAVKNGGIKIMELTMTVPNPVSGPSLLNIFVLLSLTQFMCNCIVQFKS